MSLHYRTITYDATEPSVNYTGDIWIQNIDDSYTAYMYIVDMWIPLLSGGVYVAETSPDNHYINVYEQNNEPEGIKNGWFWIKSSTGQAFIYLNGFFPIAS